METYGETYGAYMYISVLLIAIDWLSAWLIMISYTLEKTSYIKPSWCLKLEGLNFPYINIWDNILTTATCTWTMKLMLLFHLHAFGHFVWRWWSLLFLTRHIAVAVTYSDSTAAATKCPWQLACIQNKFTRHFDPINPREWLTKVAASYDEC